MEIQGEFVVPAAQSEVWALFRDVPTLVQFLPGCSDVRQLDDTHYRAKMVNRVKFMTLQFDVEGELTAAEPERHLEAQMTGKPAALAGYFRTVLSINLSPRGEAETHVTYSLQSTMTGRLASFGELLMRPVVEETARGFTDNIVEHFRKVGQR
ncbi:MAG: SRPBCC family protein [Alicyclobacillus sp.]|nr:SRPBCC family protein [Alicyclobacillus sp.]